MRKKKKVPLSLCTGIDYIDFAQIFDATVLSILLPVCVFLRHLACIYKYLVHLLFASLQLTPTERKSVFL